MARWDDRTELEKKQHAEARVRELEAELGKALAAERNALAMLDKEAAAEARLATAEGQIARAIQRLTYDEDLLPETRIERGLAALASAQPAAPAPIQTSPFRRVAEQSAVAWDQPAAAPLVIGGELEAKEDGGAGWKALPPRPTDGTRNYTVPTRTEAEQAVLDASRQIAESWLLYAAQGYGALADFAGAELALRGLK